MAMIKPLGTMAGISINGFGMQTLGTVSSSSMNTDKSANYRLSGPPSVVVKISADILKSLAEFLVVEYVVDDTVRLRVQTLCEVNRQRQNTSLIQER